MNAAQKMLGILYFSAILLPGVAGVDPQISAEGINGSATLAELVAAADERGGCAVITRNEDGNTRVIVWPVGKKARRNEPFPYLSSAVPTQHTQVKAELELVDQA